MSAFGNASVSTEPNLLKNKDEKLNQSDFNKSNISNSSNQKSGGQFNFNLFPSTNNKSQNLNTIEEFDNEIKYNSIDQNCKVGKEDSHNQLKNISSQSMDQNSNIT